MTSDRITVVIADDETLARDRVRDMLAVHADIAIVGECATPAEVLALVRDAAPALLLLDIRLAGGSGLTALSEIAVASRPVVIFLTAYPEFALEAFDLAAADYLVKPFDQQRFDRALDRARRLLLVQPSQRAQRTARPRERFAVRKRGEILFVKAAEIDWIQAEGNYSSLHASRGAYLIRESLQSVGDSLDPSVFVRVHRSAMVNVDRAVRVVTRNDGATFIVLTTGDEVPLGPSYRSRLEELFGAK